MKKSSFAGIAAIALTLALSSSGCSDSPESLLASAKKFSEKNDHPAAIIQLKNALQKNPNLAEARFLLGRSQLESGDVVSAEKELRRALELKYPIEQVAPPLARALVALQEPKKALDEFAGITVAGPAAKAELRTALGYAHLAVRNVSGARAEVTEALSADPKYVPAHLAQARIYAIDRQLEQALAQVDTAIAISGADAEAWQLKGDILLFQGNAEPALAAYRKALAAKANYLPSHSSIVSLLMQQQNFEEAGKQLQAMKAIAPKHPRTLYLQALLDYRNKKLPEAEAAVQQALSVAPENLATLVLAAVIKSDLRSYAQSEALAQKVLSRVPNHPIARRVLITGYLRVGQTAKAIEAVKPALDPAEKDPQLLALAGEAYMLHGDHAQATQLFGRAAKLDPNNAATRTSLALSRLARGETDRAFDDLEQIAATDPGTRADLALISAHLQKRAYDRALVAISVLEKKRPAAALPHDLRGGVLLAKNDRVSARKSFERALEVEPLYFPAASSLAKLDLADKKPDAARQRFEAILAKDPKNLQALLALAELRAHTGGTPSEVAALIKNAVAAHPGHPAPRIALIGVYLSANEPKSAANAAREALAAVREDVGVMAAAASAYEAAGDTTQAIAMYSSIAKLEPNSPRALLAIAGVHMRAKHKEEAAQSLRQALTMVPSLVEAQRGLIAIHLDDGRVQEALSMAQEVQRQRPKQSIGYMLEGDIYASKEKWADAANSYRKGLKNVNATDLAIRLHTALAASGSGAEAFSAKWLKDNPEDGVFRFHLAKASIVGKNYQAAVQQYLKVLEGQPDNAAVLNNLAWVLAQLQDPKALQYAESAHKLAPNRPEIMDTLGVLLLEKGDPARGVQLLRRASMMAPSAADIRLNLAKGLVISGQKEEAKKELDELAKLGDKFEGQREVAKLRQQL